MIQQKSAMTSQMQEPIQQPTQMQMHQQQLGMQPMQSHVQQENFEMQPQLQPNVMNKQHMYGEMPASDGGMMVSQQQQQHPHFVGPIQQIPMQIDHSSNQCIPIQHQQKSLSYREQSGMTQNISGSMPMQTQGKEIRYIK